MARNSSIKLGGFALIDKYYNEKAPIAEFKDLLSTVDQAIGIYHRHFPDEQKLIIYLHDETAERFGVMEELASLPVRRDRQVPQGYVWVAKRDVYEVEIQ